MKGIVAALIGLMATSCGTIAAERRATSEVAVTIQGVRVVKPRPAEDDTLLKLHNDAGTTVALLVTEPGGSLIAFDSESSRVKSFADNKGKNLTKPEPGGKVENVPESWVFKVGPKISRNRKYCNLEVSMPGVPTKGTTALAISGNLVLKVAREKKIFTAEQVALRVGTTVKAGPIALKITRAGKPQFGGEHKAFGVEFQATQDLDAVERMQFFDVGGKEIEAGGGRGFGKLGDRTYWTMEYRFDHQVDTARIVATYWNDMKRISVPFDLTVSLGL